MYGAYHHITVLGKEDMSCDHIYDVVGSLCENNDKFAIDRKLPQIDKGDYLEMIEGGGQRKGELGKGERQEKEEPVSQ